MMRAGVMVSSLAAVAWLASCTDLNQVAQPDEVLVLTASPDAVPADGFSATSITAQISPNSSESLRDVVFSTTLGRFAGADPATPQIIVATADSEGRAAVALQSTAQTGTAVVSAEIRDGQAVKVARSIEVRFEPLDPSDVIVVSPSADRAPADGASVTSIFARISGAVPLTQRSILFTTTAGSFGPVPQQTTRTAGSDNVAVAELVSPRETGVALVSATINNIRASTAVTFERALPDRIALTVFGSLQIPATFASKVTLQAQLERIVGEVTPGTEVIFRAFDESTGSTFGFFSGATLSDDFGNVVAEFTPGNTTERGEATIRARIPGTEISGRVRIEIVDP